MSLTVVKGLQSEIFVPITPPMVWTPVEKELKDMTVALATAAGVHQIDQERRARRDLTLLVTSHGERSMISAHQTN